MKANGVKKPIFLAVLFSVLCVGIGVAAAVNHNPIENRFPMWKKAGEQRTNSYAILSVIGRETVAADSSAPPREEIRVRIENTGEAPLTGGAYFCVDYYWEGEKEWYTVYHPDQVPAYAVSYEAKSFEKRFQVPKNLLRVPGKYRLYVSGLGYCALED